MYSHTQFAMCRISTQDQQIRHLQQRIADINSTEAQVHSQEAVIQQLQAQLNDASAEIQTLQHLELRAANRGREYVNAVRWCYMELLAIGVSETMCSKAVKCVIDNLTVHAVDIKSLPSRFTVSSFLKEGLEVTKAYVAHAMVDQYKDGGTLQIDEATMKQKGQVAVSLALAKETVSLGVHRVATHFAMEQVDMLQETLDEYKAIAADLGHLNPNPLFAPLFNPLTFSSNRLTNPHHANPRLCTVTN